MRRILLDTNGYAAFKRNDPIATGIIRSVEYIGLSVVVLGELLGGFKGGSKEKKNIEELKEFMDSPRVHLLQVDEETAEFYAKIYWDLKRKGNPIPSNDMKKYTSQEIKEFVSKPMFDEKVILNKDPSWPKISIVTPSYNQAQFLERTILSEGKMGSNLLI